MPDSGDNNCSHSTTSGNGFNLCMKPHITKHLYDNTIFVCLHVLDPILCIHLLSLLASFEGQCVLPYREDLAKQAYHNYWLRTTVDTLLWREYAHRYLRSNLHCSWYLRQGCMAEHQTARASLESFPHPWNGTLNASTSYWLPQTPFLPGARTPLGSNASLILWFNFAIALLLNEQGLSKINGRANQIRQSHDISHRRRRRWKR